MKVTAFVTHPDCSLHDTGWGHPEHQGRLPAVARAVYRDMLTLFEPLLEVEATPAGETALLAAHDSAYVERVLARVAEAAVGGEPLELEHGTRVSGASWDAATAAAGSVITAVDRVMGGDVRNAFCAIRPPGAEVGRGRAGGYGIFNSVAIGCLHARRLGVERVLVLHLGDGPGDGLTEILSGEPGIRVRAVHRRPSRSGAGTLRTGAGLDEVRAGILEVFAADAAEPSPDLVLVSLGLDLLAGDPEGQLSLAPTDLSPVTRLLVDHAEAEARGRLVSVLDAGYSPPAMGVAVVHHLRALAGSAEPR